MVYSGISAHESMMEMTSMVHDHVPEQFHERAFALLRTIRDNPRRREVPLDPAVAEMERLAERTLQLHSHTV